MAEADYSASEHFADSTLHPALRPAFSLRNRLARLLWGVVAATIFRWSPRPFHTWRALLLRCFGASIGLGVHVYPRAKVWAPWNLRCDDYAGVADGAELYNPAPLHLGEFCVVSQDSYICGATHDYNDPDFPLLAFRMSIGKRAWICARASVSPGVQVGEGAVLAMCSVATRDLEPWGVYAGMPAKRVRERQHNSKPNTITLPEPRA